MSRTADLQVEADETEAFDPGEAEAAGAQTGAPSPSISEPPLGKAPDQPWYKRPLWWIVIFLVVVAVGVGTTLWWLYARQYESTDDAFIDTHIVLVAPQVAGRVVDVPVKDNQEVKKGQLLVKIDPADFQVALDMAQAAAAEAQGKLKQAEAKKSVADANAAQAAAQVQVVQANAHNAAQTLERYKKLSRAAISQQQLDDAIAAAASTAAQVEAAQKQTAAAAAQAKAAITAITTAKAAIASAQAKVEQAKLMLSYTLIRATEDGLVTRKSVVPGNYVDVGQQLMAIVPKQVWVTANFKETQLTHIKPGQPVDISVDAFPDVDLHGTVDSIQAGSGAVFSLLPPQNATGNYVKVVQRVPVKITFNNLPEHPRLVPGMSVEPTVKVR